MPTCQECLQCPPVPVLIPVCADPEFCAEIIDTRCVVYKGTTLPNNNILDGDRLDAILVKIDNNSVPVTAQTIIDLFNSSQALKDVITNYVISQLP